MAKTYRAQIVDVTADAAAFSVNFIAEFFLTGDRRNVVETNTYTQPIDGFNTADLITQIAENVGRLNNRDIDFENIKSQFLRARFDEDGIIDNRNKAERDSE